MLGITRKFETYIQMQSFWPNLFKYSFIASKIASRKEVMRKNAFASEEDDQEHISKFFTKMSAVL